MNTDGKQPELLSITDIFGEPGSYIVPMYQRNYSWGEVEIGQLVRDIVDAMEANADSNYYLGTLVTFPRQQPGGGYGYELIDGQQRFTTLILMLMYLEERKAEVDKTFELKANLQFECRETSTAALRYIRAVPADGYDGGQTTAAVGETGGEAIHEGYRLLGSEFRKQLNGKKGLTLEKFCRYFFNQVKLLRVEVPPHTDVNHYFEVMNNRGEQLEKHEVLKAKLLSVLDSKSAHGNAHLSALDPKSADGNAQREQAAFNRIWEACSDMSRYVQMSFNTGERTKLFGGKWSQFKADSFTDIADKISVGTESEAALDKGSGGLDTLIAPSETPSSPVMEDTDQSERFHSVIDFPNFLLHVLRVTCRQKLVNADAEKVGEIPLDDKRLIPVFESNLLSADVSPNAEQVKQFGFDLLRCRYLFDRYVIKRETTAKGDGWSLQHCYKYDYKGNAHSSYKNTFDSGHDENIQDRILMLQAALHVSTPTRPYKYWLSGVLDFLAQQDRSIDDVDKFGEELYRALELITQAFVFNRYLSDNRAEYDDIIYKRSEVHIPRLSERKVIEKHLQYGQIQNNLVFNYLDFLLWKNGWCDVVPRQSSGFRFTQRSSVEHMQPQTAFVEARGTQWKGRLDEFGNLCLISRESNSRLTDRGPKQKAEKVKGVGVGSAVSLKQYVMARLTLDGDGDWSIEKMQMHGQEMIDLMCNSVKRKSEAE